MVLFTIPGCQALPSSGNTTFMSTLTSALVAAGIAYLIGSLPFGFLVAKIFKGTDIRTQGSGNIGATNVARTLGAKWGILVFLLDAVKGFLPVWLLPRLLLEGDDFTRMQMHFEIICGVATVLGHIFPVWLKFRGGKGVATSAGVVLVISRKATLIAVVVYVFVLWWKRIGSLASLAAGADVFHLPSGVRLHHPKNQPARHHRTQPHLVRPVDADRDHRLP